MKAIPQHTPERDPLWGRLLAGVRPLLSSQLRRNMTSSLVQTGLNFLVTAAAYPIYLHYLGYEQYGLWLVLAAVLGSAQLGNLGINGAVSKFVAQHYGRGDAGAVERDVATAHAALLVSGSVVIAVILLCRTPIVAAFKLAPGNAALVRKLLPAVSLLSLYVFLVRATTSTLVGLGRMDLVNYARIGSRLLGVVLAAVLLHLGRGVNSLVWSYAASEAACHLFCLGAIARWVRIRYWRPANLSGESLKRLLTFGSGLLGSSTLELLLGPFNKLMLSRTSGVETIPIYEIAYNASMYFRGLITNAFQALMPEVSRLSATADGGTVRIREIFRRAMRLTFRWGAPLFGLVFVAAPVLLRVWLRRDFDPRLPATFRLMLVGAFLSLVGATPYYFLMGLGHAGSIFLAAAMQTGVDVLVLGGLFVAGVTLTPQWVAAALLTVSAAVEPALPSTSKARGTVRFAIWFRLLAV